MNEAGVVEQVNDYTPFGVQMKNSFAETSDQRYKYNGKELDRMLGLDLYDYGARFYDARIARWQTIDPLCEKYYSISPYAYCANNPIRFIDPDGKDATICIMDNNITIAVNIYIYGSGATSEIAKTMQQDIMKFWGKNADTNTNWTYKDNKKKKEYNVTFDVNVKLYDKENPSSIPGLFSGRYNPFNRDNYIEVTDTDRSYVSGGDEGVWRSNGRNGKTLSQDDPAVHEFGHLLGFDDRYTDKFGSNEGWKGNVMAEPTMKGKVEQRNINALVTPIVNEYNLSGGKGKFKTSINYSVMKY
jgi:RHS repeat-associated protein